MRPVDADALMAKLNRKKAGPANQRYTEGFNDCLMRVRSMVHSAPTLTTPNEWVSVEERLPEYNPGTGAKSYWVAKKDNAGNWQMKIAQYCDYGYAMTVDAETEVTWRDWDFTKIVNDTHWMPLPAPPTKEE